MRIATAAEFANPDAFVLSDGAGNNRYPSAPAPTPPASPLSAAEVRAMLEEAFTVMSRARAQIRRPLDSRAQVTITVVDTNGADPRPGARARRADIRHRRLAAEGAHRGLLLGATAAARTAAADPERRRAGFVAAARDFFSDPTRADRQDRLRRPLERQPLAAVFPRRRGRPPDRRRSRGRSRSSTRSPPACSRR